MNQKDWWNARFQNDKNLIDKTLYAKFDTKTALSDALWIKNHKTLIDKLIAQCKSENRIPKALDLGCGLGQISKYFTDMGFDVTAVDFSENAIEILKSNFPNIKTLQHDIIKPLPFKENEFDLIIANLSLHYFNEQDTHNAIAEIHRVISKNGLLIGAVISTDEFECAKNLFIFKEIEPNFYHETNHKSDKVKTIRFFNRKDIDRFFNDFEFLYLENKFEQRMGISKGAWEFVAKIKN